MPIARSNRPLAVTRIRAEARRLLDRSTLCAIATAAPGNRAHVNTAYFAWSRRFDLVWLSEPNAEHSRNLLANSTAAIAVYDSSQFWGKSDQGIQLFGSARELDGSAAREAGRLYAERFPDYASSDLSGYRFYRFRPSRMKLFDESALGAGVFVTAAVRSGGQVAWERTEVHQPSAGRSGEGRRPSGAV